MILIRDVREGMDVRISEIDPETAKRTGLSVGASGRIIKSPHIPLVYYCAPPGRYFFGDDGMVDFTGENVMEAQNQQDALVMVSFETGVVQGFRLNVLEAVDEEAIFGEMSEQDITEAVRHLIARRAESARESRFDT